MRNILLAACGIICLTLPAYAETASPNNQAVCAALTLNRIAPIVAQYPNGGAPLANAIATAVEGDPTLARDAAAISSKVTQDQKLALAAGLAQAAAFLKRKNNATGLSQIQQALLCADGLTRSAFNAASASLFADQNGQGDGNNGGGNTGGAFSPSGATAGVGGSVVD
jgi:hypothetical protein